MDLSYGFLGVDIGTTTIKFSFIDDNNVVLYSNTKQSDATISCSNPLFNEQDVEKIVSLVFGMFEDLKHHKFWPKVVGFCGQMHGIVLWNSKKPKLNFRKDKTNYSNLYTWQDGRCSKAFLATLPKSTPPLQSGYGCATLLWLKTHQLSYLSNFDASGTIMDFFVWLITDAKPSIGPQLANSWGYFNALRLKWEVENQYLPEIRTQIEHSTVFEQNFVILPTLGDTQCAFASATNELENCVVVNFGTSSQVMFETSSDSSSLTNAFQIWPYDLLEKKRLAVAASMNGGNVLDCLMSIFCNICSSLTGKPLSKQEVWSKVMQQSEHSNTTLSIKPRLYQERHENELSATELHCLASDLSVDDFFIATCRGLIQNLHEMAPEELLLEHQVKQLVCIGKALTENKILQLELKRAYQNLPISFAQNADSAFGAALLAKSIKV